MDYYSVLKKKKILPFVTWMNLKGIMLSEIKQTGERWILYGITYMWNLKRKKLNSEKKSRIVAVKGWGEEEMIEVDKRYKLSVVSWISSKDLTYSIVTIVDNTLLYNWNLMGMLINLMVGPLSQCISNHHIVQFKYITI